MFGPFSHRIDPIIASVGGFHVWWYGLSYALGFSQMHLFTRRRREALNLSLREVYSSTLMFSVRNLANRAARVATRVAAARRRTRCACPPNRINSTTTHANRDGSLRDVTESAGLRGGRTPQSLRESEQVLRFPEECWRAQPDANLRPPA